MAVDSISYSAWKHWYMCPFRHKLIKIDGINLFNGNAHTGFGKALHNTSQKMLELEKENLDMGRSQRRFFRSRTVFLKTVSR